MKHIETLSIETSEDGQLVKIIDVLNSIPHAIGVLDTQMRVESMNSCLEVLTGYGARQAKGIMADYILRSDIVSRDFQSVLDSSEPFSREGDMINGGRKKIPIRITASPLRDDRDSVAGIVVVVEDISSMRELDKKKNRRDMAGAIIGHSDGMQEVFDLLPVLAATDATVLITGETGTGKDLLAETIHQASGRAQHPFIKVNCGAIPEALLESELFGHKRGAFTGAHGDKPGMFRLAQGGTIFLTEIGDLPLQLQVKLLTVLDDREFYPLGSSRKTSVDVRIITGTHRDLKQLVQEGKFREDLFFRLNVLRAHLPPLRQRDGDVRLLLDYFLQKISGSTKKNIKGFTKEAYAALESYPFPGNIREIRNIVEFAVSMCQGNIIDVAQLPSNILACPAGKASAENPLPGSGHGPDAYFESGASWTAIEKKKILAALQKTNGNRSKAAQVLGWGRSTLWRKIKQYDIG